MIHKLREARERDENRRKWFVWSVVGGFGLIVALVFWILGMYTGFWPIGNRFAYEQWSDGPENLHGVSGWHTGHNLGFNTFYLFKGQRVYIAYDATIYSGAFVVRIYQLAKPGLPEVTSRRLIKSGAGRIEVAIPEDGIYAFGHYAGIAPASRSGAYEANYAVSWGIVP